MSKWIIISDLHFDDKPENEYRFNIADEVIKHKGSSTKINLAILGDLTEKKDNHSSILIDKIMKVLWKFSYAFNNVVILKGNHDYVVEDTPFFKFLGEFESFTYVCTEPVYIDGGYFIPHSKTFAAGNLPKGTEFVGIHQTINGAISQSNFKLNGNYSVDYFDLLGVPVFSGDVHKPQSLSKNFTYVGSPYNVYFGDDFNGRIIKTDFETNEIISILTNFPRKYKVSGTMGEINEFIVDKIQEKDQVKIEVNIEFQDIGEVEGFKNHVKKQLDILGAELFGVEVFIIKNDKKVESEEQEKFILFDKNNIYNKFIMRENIDKSLALIGESIINGA